MSEVSYQELITQSFRDNAIRSVMLIDDNFLPYDKLVELNGNLDSQFESIKTGTKQAAQIHRFFQSKRITCDIDQGTENIDIEKIRKCDLIILDYHLELNSPERSLKVISCLSESEHMNTVVIYTADPDLDKVWLQIATNLSCVCSSATSQFFLNDKKGLDIWNDITESQSEIPPDMLDEISNSDLEHYLTHGEIPQITFTNLKKINPEININICKALIVEKLRPLDLLKQKKDGKFITGKNSKDLRWLYQDNVFIVIKEKGTDSDDSLAKKIWDEIARCLEDWRPTYYQLLASEIQNNLENSAIPFSNKYLHDLEGQAGWLYQILKLENSEERNSEVTKLIGNLADEVKKCLVDSPRSLSYAKKLIENIYKMRAGQLHIFCSDHMGISRQGNEDEILNNIGHAINKSLCSFPDTPPYISSGSIVSISRNNVEEVYLCVSPACETVPGQHTGLMAEELKPHRLMKFIKLEEQSLSKALKDATKSNVIFTINKGKRVAYKALDNNNQPKIKYMLVKSHDIFETKLSDRKLIALGMKPTGTIESLTFEEFAVEIFGQLRDHYAARFQAIASHHMGRIGVDFIPFAKN